MTRTQIQLPDEITRRGIELFLARFPQPAPERKKWQLPRVEGGGIKVPLEKLREIASDDESTRSLRRR